LRDRLTPCGVLMRRHFSSARRDAHEPELPGRTRPAFGMV
jgi:hypothetical protein